MPKSKMPISFEARRSIDLNQGVSSVTVHQGEIQITDPEDEVVDVSAGETHDCEDVPGLHFYSRTGAMVTLDYTHDG